MLARTKVRCVCCVVAFPKFQCNFPIYKEVTGKRV